MGPTEGKRHTSRGIEFLIDDDIDEQRDILRYRAMFSVLQEQKRQKDLGIFDANRIALTYKQSGASKGQMIAEEFGKMDAAIVRGLAAASAGGEGRQHHGS